MKTKYPEIAVVDIETTAYKHFEGHIVEIAIVLLDSKTGDINVLLDTPVREASDINWRAWIFKNSSLTAKMVSDAPPWKEVLPKAQELFDKYPVTAFNKEFDLDFLEGKGIKVCQEEECIMLAATPICRIPNGFGGNKWPKAIEAWNHFFPKEEYVDQHRAKDDAIHEARILFELLKLE